MFQKRRRPKRAALTVVGLPYSKAIKRSNPKNLIVPFIKLKSAKKDKTLLECVVSTSTAKHILKSVPVKEGKLKTDVNIISDLIRDEKYANNIIHIFHLL